MILADYHVHSDFSTDSNTPMEAQLTAAQSLGLAALCFTDHMDFGYPARYGGGFQLDTERYFEKLALLKKQQERTGGVSLRTGMEIGMQAAYAEEGRRLVRSSPLDFVICSSHLVDGRDPYYMDYWEYYGSEREGIRRYFEAVLENLSVFTDFEVYGHLDYIFRYTPSRRSDKTKKNAPVYSRKEYGDVTDEILKTLAVLGKGLEVNSAGYKYGLSHANPHEAVITRYLELGGEIITIGSDSHQPEHLAFAFEKTRSMLLSLGLKYYAIFEAQRPSFCPL